MTYYLHLSYIYLGYFVCVSVIHNCGTLCYSFSFINQADQGFGGIEEGGIKDGEIGKRQIVEGGCEEVFHCLILTKEK